MTTLTSDQQLTLDQLTAKIVKVCPHVTTAYSCTLEDVLRAIPSSDDVFVTGNGLMRHVSDEGYCDEFWEFGSPLNDQRPELHTFLNNLLP